MLVGSVIKEEFYGKGVGESEKHARKMEGQVRFDGGSLIKSVLSSLPLFYFSLYKMPTMVTKELERLQRDFLWRWGSKGRKIT